MTETRKRPPPPWGPGKPCWTWTSLRDVAASLEEDYEERAAIIEYDGGLSRPKAEARAYRAIEERARELADRRLAAKGEP
jgi:hypothetical protein